MPKNKKKLNILNKFNGLSPLKQLLAIVIIFVVAILISSVAVYAYQTMYPSTDTTPEYSGGSSNCPGNQLFYNGHCEQIDDKPVIYLYPTQTEDIKVKLDYNGTLTSTYPEYNTGIHGWYVTANPDGSLTNKTDGKPYSYLFWEGTARTDPAKFDTGFVVKGSDIKDFLQATLSKLGLTPKEYNEMIVYWLPKMEHNKYNLIHFAGKDYTDTAKLTIAPAPDSILRVFMVFKPIDKPQIITTQQLPTFERKGFTVVEWGGTEVK